MKRQFFSAAVISAAALIVSIGGPANAQADVDYIRIPGKVSSAVLHRAIACGAEPGGKCVDKPIRWSKADAKSLTVGFVEIDPTYPNRHNTAANKALNAAIVEINGAGSGVQMTRVSNQRADIEISLINDENKPLIEAEGDFSRDAATMYVAAYFNYNVQGTRIRQCWIVFGSQLRPVNMRAVMLEEVTQCLGLKYDVFSKYYKNKSIFAERSNGAKRLRGQDAEVLRIHYPPN